MSEPLVSVRGVSKLFRAGAAPAVEDVSFDIDAGSTLGLVGESGSGKSTLGRMIIGLLPVSAGDIGFEGSLVTRAAASDLRRLRAQMQVVFQDPVGSLNPRRTVGESLALPMINFGWDRARIRERTRALFDLVGLDAAHADRYPHQFSGGQCQRIGIARALALGPRFLFLDEPVSALDVSVQAQIMNLLSELRGRLALTFLFVSHDLKLVRYFCDRTMVLYHGRVLESGPSHRVFDAPLHPYTVALRRAVLPVRAQAERLPAVTIGEIGAGAAAPRDGCNFADRCPDRFGPCGGVRPGLRLVEPGRRVACHLFDPAHASARRGPAGPVSSSEKE